jgi:hypothetical protein
MCIEQIDTYSCGHTHPVIKYHPGATEPCDVMPKIFVPTAGDCRCSKEDICWSDCDDYTPVSSTNSDRATRTPSVSERQPPSVTYQHSLMPAQAPPIQWCVYHQVPPLKAPQRLPIPQQAPRPIQRIHQQAPTTLSSLTQDRSLEAPAKKEKPEKPKVLRQPPSLYTDSLYCPTFASTSSPAPTTRSYMSLLERRAANDNLVQADLELKAQELDLHAAQKRLYDAEQKLFKLYPEALNPILETKKQNPRMLDDLTDSEYEAIRIKQDILAAEVDESSRRVSRLARTCWSDALSDDSGPMKLMNDFFTERECEALQMEQDIQVAEVDELSRRLRRLEGGY